MNIKRNLSQKMTIYIREENKGIIPPPERYSDART